MSNSLERRMLLRGAGVVGVSAVGVAAVPAAASAHGTDAHGRNVLGAWRIRHTDDPPSNTTGIAIVSFAAGGVFTTEEIPAGTLGLGTWAADSSGVDVLFYESEPATDGGPGVVVKVRVHGHVQGDTISGTYRLTVRSASDDSVLARGTGTFHGERLRA